MFKCHIPPKCVFSSDFDKDCQKIYELNFKEKPYGDITKVDTKLIPMHDILTAGFPCQPFSISGKRGGFEDTRGTLFFDIAKIIKIKKPKIVLLENVANFAKHDDGKTLNTVKKVITDYHMSLIILSKVLEFSQVLRFQIEYM